MTARRGRQCGVAAYPHRFRHHFSHTWLDRGGQTAGLRRDIADRLNAYLWSANETEPAPGRPDPGDS
jgi:hypothetical protein